jgi:hypothetical protein
MDLLTGVLTVVTGLGILVMPWILRLTGRSLASATIVAGGVIVTLLGLALVRRAPRPWRSSRQRE